MSNNNSNSNLSASSSTGANEKPKLLYQEEAELKGETVLCYHGPLLYEAKCLKAELKNKSPQYLIHYSGWSKSWDEWVGCPRVLKFNEENLKKQQELLATHGNSKIVSKIKSNTRKSVLNASGLLGDKTNDQDDKSLQDISINTSVASPSNTRLSVSSDSRRKRQKIEESNEDENYTIKSEICIKINDELKQILNDDFHNICINNKLVHIPANNTVEMILEDYSTYKLDKKFDKNVITTTVEAIKDYFNATLPTKLLYRFERAQFNELVKNETRKPSELYGSIHLLRLFGDLLSYTYWDEISIKQLTLHLEDVLRYLTEKRSTLFTNKAYINPPANYQLKAI